MQQVTETIETLKANYRKLHDREPTRVYLSDGKQRQLIDELATMTPSEAIRVSAGLCRDLWVIKSTTDILRVE
jgi:hypothetical protein